MNLFTKIADLDVTVRFKTICKHLEVDTIYDLMNVKLPEIGSTVCYIPIARVHVVYTAKIDSEVQEILSSQNQIDLYQSRTPEFISGLVWGTL